ncbi:hypothetical protein EV122DRAFT_253284 [Schizophyllum commune]
MPKATTSENQTASGSQACSRSAPYNTEMRRKVDTQAKLARPTKACNDFEIYDVPIATAAHLLLLAREVPRIRGCPKSYGLRIPDIIPMGGDLDLSEILKRALRKPVVARRLRVLVIRGNNSEPASRYELTSAFLSLIMPDLRSIKILRPGISSGDWEQALYLLFVECGESGKLQHVALQWHCCYQAGFTKWLESKAAANLVTLRLQTNADVRTRITDALSGGHWFPKLRRLSLIHIQGLTPEVLIKKLQTRYDHGLHHRLIVEITDEVSPAVLAIAREINVAFRTVSDSLLEEVEDL